MVRTPNLKELYDLINREGFDGDLPGSDDVIVVWNKRMRTVSGRVHYSGKTRADDGKPRIEINFRMFQMREFEGLRATLTHEMCHLWCYLEHGIWVKHGPIFQRKMTEVTGIRRDHTFHDHVAEAHALRRKGVVINCENCGELGRRAQMPRKHLRNTYTCKRCGGKVSFVRSPIVR